MRRAGRCDSIASRPARRFADDDRSDLVVVTCFCLVSECVSGVSECITGGRPGGRVPTESRPAQSGLLPRRGHESGLPLARGLERLVAGGLAARRVLFSASASCLLDLFMRSAIESGAAPRL